jgi:hypothetical protein
VSMSKIDWPSREEWAKGYQNPWWVDPEGECPFKDKYSHRLTDYATDEEIAALSAALTEIYRELGRKLKTANQRIDPSHRQQKGEGGSAWGRRIKLLPEEDQAALKDARKLQNERSNVNYVLARIRDDAIPNEGRNCNYVPGKAGELVKPFNDRYDAAYRAASDAYEREYIATHVPEDAAWEKELERRRNHEAWRGGLIRQTD